MLDERPVNNFYTLLQSFSFSLAHTDTQLRILIQNFNKLNPHQPKKRTLKKKKKKLKLS